MGLPTAADAIIPFVANTGAIFTAFSPIFTLIGALGGVWLGGHLQSQQAEKIYEKQRQDRLADDTRSTAAQNNLAKERKAFVAHRFARVLERYAKECATVGSNNNNPAAGATHIPDLKFPNDIEWEVIGPLRAAELRDFQSTIPLVKGFAVGRAGRYDPETSSTAREHAKEVFSDTSARLGRSAWKLAEVLRREAGLPPFAFVEDGWDYAAFLQDDEET